MSISLTSGLSTLAGAASPFVPGSSAVKYATSDMLREAAVEVHDNGTIDPAKLIFAGEVGGIGGSLLDNGLPLALPIAKRVAATVAVTAVLRKAPIAP